MAGHITLAMIKPHAVREKNVGKIISRIEEEGFAVLLAKNLVFRPEGVREFYQEHADKPFFNDLVATMTSGPLWALVLSKPNAVEEWRNLIGNTNSAEASEGTIRHAFGNHSNTGLNAVHGSDSDHSAFREIGFFFGREIAMAEKADAANNQQ